MIPAAVTAWMERDAQPVEAGGGAFTVRLPAWGRWLRLMDAAGEAGGDGRTRLDPSRMLRRWLTATVRRTDGGRALSGEELDRLPSAVADALLAATCDLVEAQRRDLALSVTETTEFFQLHVAGGTLRLRGWTFAQRADHLRRHLRLTPQGVALDVAGLEIAELSCCARWADDDADLGEDVITRWPLVLGEEAAAAIARLNQPAGDEDALLRVCHAQGHPHPDLDAAVISRATGLAPTAIDALPARQAARLAAALRLIDVPVASVAPAPGPAPRQPDGDPGLTRILVCDG